MAQANALIDAAVQLVAAQQGIAVAKPSAGESAGGAVVDSAALDAFAAQVTGSDGVLAQTARFVLGKLGLNEPEPAPEEDANAAVVAAALDAFAAQVTGSDGVLAQTARFVLGKLGLNEPEPAPEEDANAAVVATVEAELGADWPEQVAPRFDARKAILFDDRWASAREDLARAFYNNDAAALNGDFTALGEAVAAEARWFAERSREDGRADLAGRYAQIADAAAAPASADPAPYAGDVAVVTGVAPNSIAAQVVNGLLAGGATVIATSHSFRPSVKAWARETYRTHARAGAQLWLVPANLSSYRDVDALVDWVGHKAWARETYRTHARAGAQLWLVPANLSSYRDVDALVDWVGHVQKKTNGATTTVLKPAYEPSLFFPFAAPPVHGSLADSGALFESQARLMLWGVERAIAGFAAIGADTDVQHCLHVVLPGSPNRGVFGGDGAYGEVKSAFDAIVNRARAEHDWSGRVTFACMWCCRARRTAVCSAATARTAR